jgi:hypothetical protein
MGKGRRLINPNGFQFGDGRLVAQAQFRDGGVVSLMQQEDKLRVADTKGVAVAHDFAPYRNPIDEGTVVAIQVGELKALIHLFDGAVSPRD